MTAGSRRSSRRRGRSTSTSYTYPDWEWVNGVAVIGPDGRVDPVRRVLTFTSAPLASRSRSHRTDRAEAFCLDRPRSTRSSSSSSPTSSRRTRPHARAARSRASSPVSKGWLKASHREKDETRSTPTRPFYTHTNPQPLKPGEVYSSTSRCCRCPTCSRKATASGWSSPTAIRGDRRRVLASVSSDADGDRHVPSRRHACVVHHAAGDRLGA